ncbi:DUF1028 domain-containing protein [Methyloceanibacter sp. wino2]|uniref:DUF1028 domain-containing protein n=1 Tax=Methyloceanibacter sp. wino2 TaxID=2170729 RepID=UPI000D3E6247|nr:DUF1028 domain-containing protein [Methyloceanibacter sp. wino2]
MTYSILARDPKTGEMGVATQSQAFAVGHSVPWTMPGFGVIATQSMGEPAYGDLGLDALRAGLTASEALTAISSIDAHPERRQVAMIDGDGRMAAYTGSACIAEAGHAFGDTCIAVANMMRTNGVWDAMVEAFERGSGTLATRLMAALHAAEKAGGDFRGQRSAAIKVVRATRSGRPWRDSVVDLRVDDHETPVDRLDALVERSARYNRMVSAFERALDGQASQALADVVDMPVAKTKSDADLQMWRAAILTLAGREEEASSALATLNEYAPEFVDVFRHLETTGLVDEPAAWKRVLPGK